MGYGGGKISLFGGVDRVAVLLYVALVAVGLVAVFSASWVEGSENYFSFSHNYIKQAVWFGISLVVGVVILLLDSSLWHKIAYYLYGAALLLLVATLLFGSEVNGAKAWFKLGPVQLQTMEFAKIAIALACARLMSEYGFSIGSVRDLAKVALLLLVPLGITVLQNDTGSGLVLCSLLFMLYREGLNKWLCIPVIFIATLFILSFIFSPTVLLVALILVFTLSEGLNDRRWRDCIIYCASLFMASIVLYLVVNAITSSSFSYYTSLLIVTLISLIGVCIYAYRTRLQGLFVLVALFALSVIIVQCSAATPAEAYRGLPRHRGGSESDIQCAPIEDCHRLGWSSWQGLSRRLANTLRLGAGETYRLHILHHRRGVWLYRHDRCVVAHIRLHIAYNANGRQSTRGLRTSLLLFGRLDTALPYLNKYRYDHRHRSGHGYPTTSYLVWRLIVAGIYHNDLYRLLARRTDQEGAAYLSLFIAYYLSDSHQLAGFNG